MSVTIKDVARESGVNISTVSRALNDEYGVHPDTREHVISVAKRLKYRPNRVARGLVTGRSNTLALIISDIRNPFFAEVARGAEDAARAAGCDLILCNSDLDARKQLEYVHSLLAKHVDGILMNSVAVLSRAQQEDLAQCPVPIVLLNGATSRRTFSTVSANTPAGGSLAAEYLLKPRPSRNRPHHRSATKWQPDGPRARFSQNGCRCRQLSRTDRPEWGEQLSRRL